MQPGQRVTNTLELSRPLAEGSMGSVWVARHLVLGTEVAIKFMAPSLTADPTFVARFTREARASAQIRSMHVVQIMEHGITAENVPFIVMELLEGETLRDHLKRNGAMHLAQTAVVVQHVCKALSAAHKMGVIHRDIKPANIFLDDSDGDLFCKLIDFGVAKAQSDGLSMTQTSDRIGTPFYMCPEALISAKHVDHRGDIWGVGAVAYHCLCGQVPFYASSFAELCIVVGRGQYAPPSTVNPTLPPSVDEWFRRILVKNPNDRFDDPKEMADEFLRAVHG